MCCFTHSVWLWSYISETFGLGRRFCQDLIPSPAGCYPLTMESEIKANEVNLLVSAPGAPAGAEAADPERRGSLPGGLFPGGERRLGGRHHRCRPPAADWGRARVEPGRLCWSSAPEHQPEVGAGTWQPLRPSGLHSLACVDVFVSSQQSSGLDVRRPQWHQDEQPCGARQHLQQLLLRWDALFMTLNLYGNNRNWSQRKLEAEENKMERDRKLLAHKNQNQKYFTESQTRGWRSPEAQNNNKKLLQVF